MAKPTINMQYRLLRNNKESGPYTKAQLEASGLKPYDLLLIEGRGGAWQYASEIDDLKSIAPVIEEQPYDRFYKGKKEAPDAMVSNKQQASFANNLSASSAMVTAAIKPPKPRIRITGDKVVMIDNAALQQPQPINNIIAAIKEQPVAAPKPVVKEEAPKAAKPVRLDWEEAYSEWKGEANETAEKPAPATAQTMEEVKQRYEEAKLKKLDEKQNKTTGAARQNIMAAVAIAVLAIGGYAGYKLNQTRGTARTTQAAPTVEKAEIIVQDENNQPPSTTGDVTANTDDANHPVTTSPVQDNNTTATTLGEVKNALPGNNDKTSKEAIPPPVDKQKTSIPDNKKELLPSTKNTTANPVTKPVKKSTQQQLPVADTKLNTAANNTAATVKDKKEQPAPIEVKKSNTTPQLQPVAEPPVVKKEAPAKKINDYIAISKLGSSNAASVQNVLLSVKNKSDFPIDLAVIDIQYYAPNGRFQKGETMYVKNIDAGNNVNVRIPDSKTSGSIKYKVSLVSSEQKTLYLVGE